MVDFTRSIATAQRLIKANGREVTFLAFNTTPDTPSRPWKAVADPKASPDKTLKVFGVGVDPASAARLGLVATTDDLFKRSEQILIVSAGAQVDLREFNIVTDLGTDWKIVGVRVLRPATETVLSFVGVAR